MDKNIPSNIRQLTLNDFEDMYQIWVEGIAAAFTNPSLIRDLEPIFCRSFFQNSIRLQDVNFKIWGYFDDNVLIGWQSILPCQSAPMVWNKFAESSTYVKSGNRYHGVGRQLLIHAIYQARHHSELAYIMGYVSDGNPHVEALVTEVGFQKVGPLPKSPKDNIIGGGARNLGSTLVIWVVPL